MIGSTTCALVPIVGQKLDAGPIADEHKRDFRHASTTY